MGQFLKITTSYQHNQNDIIKRINRTLIKKIRTIIINAGIPKPIWPEILAVTIKMINRIATRTLSGMTPYKTFID